MGKETTASGDVITFESLITDLDEKIKELEGKKKQFNTDFSNAKYGLFKFLGYNMLEAATLLGIIKRMSDEHVPKKIKDEVDSIDSYPDHLFNTPLDNLKSLKELLTKKQKAMKNKKTDPLTEQTLTAIETLANSCFELASTSSSLQWKLVNSLKPKDCKEIADKIINKEYSLPLAIPNKAVSNQVKLFYAPSDKKTESENKYNSLPSQQIQAIESVINSKSEELFGLMNELNTLPQHADFVSLYENWSTAITKLMSNKTDYDISCSATLVQAQGTLNQFGSNIQTAITSLNEGVTAVKNMLDGQVAPDKVLQAAQNPQPQEPVETASPASPQSGESKKEQPDNPLNQLGDDHMSKETETKSGKKSPVVESVAEVPQTDPKKAGEEPGSIPASPASPSPSAPSDSLVYAGITKDQHGDLVENIQKASEELNNLTSNVDERYPNMHTGAKSGFFKRESDAEQYDKAKAKMKTELMERCAAASNWGQTFLKAVPPDNAFNTPTSAERQKWSECCYSLSLLFNIHYRLARLTDHKMALRQELYAAETTKRNTEQRIEQEKSDKSAVAGLQKALNTAESQVTELNEAIKGLDTTIKEGNILANYVNTSYKSFTKLKTTNKKFESKIKEYDNKLQSSYTEYAEFDRNYDSQLKTPHLKLSQHDSNATQAGVDAASASSPSASKDQTDVTAAPPMSGILEPLFKKIQEHEVKYETFFKNYQRTLTQRQDTVIHKVMGILQGLMATLASADPTKAQNVYKSVNDNYNALTTSNPAFKHAEQIIALFEANPQGLLKVIGGIKKNPNQTYELLKGKQGDDTPAKGAQTIDTLLKPLDNNPDLTDLKATLRSKLLEMKKYAKLLRVNASGEFENPELLYKTPEVNTIALPDFDLSHFDSIITPLNEAIAYLMNHVVSKLNADAKDRRRIHDEGYKNMANVKANKKQEKDYRLSSVKIFIDKYRERLNQYCIDNPDTTSKDKHLFIQSTSASNPAKAAKKELCNALYDAKIMLKGLYLGKSSDITSTWHGLTNISGIEKKLKALEKAKDIQGRTERMIYNLYAVLHVIDELTPPPAAQWKKELNNLSKKFNGASGLAMRLSGATIYKAKADFQQLIKFLIEFLNLREYQYSDDTTKNKIMQKPIKKARDMVDKIIKPSES